LGLFDPIAINKSNDIDVDATPNSNPDQNKTLDECISECSSLSEVFTLMIQNANEHRQGYSDIVTRNEEKIDSTTTSHEDFDPLMLKSSTVMKTSCNKLKSDILLDIERTYQDKPLFKIPYIKEIMSNVL